MIKRLIVLGLMLQFSVFAGAAINTAEEQAFLKIVATSEASRAAMDLEMAGKSVGPTFEEFEELGNLQIESFSDIRDLALENEFAAESKYSNRLLFVAEVGRVTREDGYPVVHINSVNKENAEMNFEPEVAVRLKANNLLLARSLRRGDLVTLLCNDLNLGDSFFLNGCELPGSFYSEMLDRKASLEFFSRSCNAIDGVSIPESFLVFAKESPSAQQALEEFVLGFAGDSSFQKSGIGMVSVSSWILGNEEYKEFRSDNPGAFGLDNPDAGKADFCASLL